MSLLNHIELSLVKGVGPTPSDTLSAEQPLVVVDLLTSDSAFALVDWSPNIPSLKSGGMWADSSISDGRTLIAGVNTNVIETMVVQLTGTTIADYASQFAKLQRMIQDARDFWDTVNQIEPVYLRWWANIAPGPQFALIYNIDMDVEWDDSNLAQAKLTLTIEREFGWRGVRPGGNPKEWTYYKRNQIFNSAVAALTTGSDHLLNATAQGRREWAQAGNNPTTLATKNYFDIPASSVPGDLDALCYLSIISAGGLQKLYFGRSTKPDIPISGVIRPPAYILNSGDAFLGGTDVTFAADTGAPISQPAGTNQRGVVSFATVATDVVRFTWNGLGRSQFDFSSMRGKFAAFVRARLSAASTVTMHLQADVVSGQSIVYPTQTLTDVGTGGVGNTGVWGFSYMGIVQFPLGEERVISGINGLGVVATADGNYTLSLYAARPGAAVSLYVADLILLPIDEVAGTIDKGSAGSYIMDNTGYSLHGKSGDFVSNAGAIESVALAGQSLTLKPNVINQVVLFENTNTIPEQSTVVNTTFTARLNIVPRWSGIRNA